MMADAPSQKWHSLFRANSAADSPKRGGAEGVKGAIGKPPCRARRREIPCNNKKQYVSFRQSQLTSLPNWTLPCFQRAMETDEVRDRPLDSFGALLRSSAVALLVGYEWFINYNYFRYKSSNMGVTAPKVSKGRSESPLVASADAKSSAAMVEKIRELGD